MKVLLDECLPIDSRHYFPGHETHTAEWAGLKGLKNGQLLKEAESAGYEVLVTIDQAIPYQQNFSERRNSILVIHASTSAMEDIIPTMGAVLAASMVIKPGEMAFAS